MIAHVFSNVTWKWVLVALLFNLFESSGGRSPGRR